MDITVWFDPAGDFLEVLFEKKAGYFRETASDSVMGKVELPCNVIGFSILNEIVETLLPDYH